ncbi:MAG: metalloregulator ArsR/SmtB family transcription factor [Pseudomonadota bacterium]
MDDLSAAAGLAALGHEARLALFRLLVRAGAPGLSVSDLRDRLDLPASTLAHHLSALVAAGLVRQEKAGRQVLNRADFARMRALLSYVDAECCLGFAEDPRAATDPDLDSIPVSSVEGASA